MMMPAIDHQAKPLRSSDIIHRTIRFLIIFDRCENRCDL